MFSVIVSSDQNKSGGLFTTNTLFLAKTKQIWWIEMLINIAYWNKKEAVHGYIIYYLLYSSIYVCKMTS